MTIAVDLGQKATKKKIYLYRWATEHRGVCSNLSGIAKQKRHVQAMDKTQESLGGAFSNPVWITQSLLMQINLFFVYIVDGRQNPGVYVVSHVGEGNRRDVFTVYRGSHRRKIGE